jgi:hypothetical protein
VAGARTIGTGVTAVGCLMVGAGAILIFETDGECVGGLLIAAGVQQFVLLIAFSVGLLLDEIVPRDGQRSRRSGANTSSRR